MSNPSPPETLLRLSLRELFVCVALVAMAIVSLLYASNAWLAIVSLLVIIMYVGALIAAVVDRGRRQAFAFGMLISMTAYIALLIYARFMSADNFNYEFHPGWGRLPTTIFLSYLFSVASARAAVAPPADVFMETGHGWAAIVLGYFGGRFATYIYARRARDREA